MKDEYRETEVRDRPILGILAALRGGKGESVVVALFTLNFLLYFIRPQDLPGLGFVGTIRLPMITTVTLAILILPKLSRQWSTQLKILLAFMFVEACRGVIGKVLDPNNSIVVNDFWQFQTWKDLALQLFGLILPVVLVINSIVRFSRIFFLATCAAFILGFYALTHAGRGPGGFLGDENDMCFILVTFLPFAFLVFKRSSSTFVRIIALLASILSLGGAVATNSRGGFLGLVAVIGTFYLASKRKLAWLFGAGLMGLVIVPFIPNEYWDEVFSIKAEVQGKKGTIEERFDTWAIVIDMWKDPKNTFTGVGLNNSPWNMDDYQPASRGHVERSLAGRAVHSMYFQLLGDLGLWGVGIIGWLILSSLLQLRKIAKQTKKILPLVEKWTRHLNQVTQEHVTAGAVDDELKEGSQVLRQLEEQFTFHRDSAPMIICSWLGALAAAVGVSVLYYPPIWFLAALSGALFLHFTKLMQVLKEVSELMEERFGYGGVVEEGEG